MKKARSMILALTMLTVLILSSCGTPTPEVITVVVTATNQPVTEAPTAESAPTLAPVAAWAPSATQAN